MSTKIEWCEETWNPVTGCSKVSAGCKHCFAEGVANRFWATQYPRVPDMDQAQLVEVSLTPSGFEPGFVAPTRPRRFTDVQCHPERLDQPQRWRKPRRVFVNSMSDLFHDAVSNDFIDKVWAVMAICAMHAIPKGHQFVILTKRPGRMREYVMGINPECIADTGAGMMEEGDGWWDQLRFHLPKVLPNVILGVSVEDQETADERVRLLRQTPAACRMISLEPQLNDVTLSSLLNGIGWVVQGGESGTHARPFKIEWARRTRYECRYADVPHFLKQLGAMAISSNMDDKRHCGDSMLQDGFRLLFQNRKGGDPSEWPEDLRVREFPEVTP